MAFEQTSGFPGGCYGAGDPGSIPGWEDPLAEPTSAFLPEESRGQRSWRATVHGVTKSQTQGEPPTLSLFTSTTGLREDLPQEVI